MRSRHARGLGTHLRSLYRTAPRKRWLLRSAAAGRVRFRERTVVSPDGTPLAVRVTGHGPPLVLVHGSLSGKDNAFTLVEPALAERYQVWSYDRRGRGRSGDAAEHSLSAEVEDLLSVLSVAGAPAHVVAHSFGAVCALFAARRGAQLRSLVLYEPPLQQRARNEGAVRTIAGLVDAGRLDDALAAFYRDVADVTEDELELLRSMPPVWTQLRDAVRTLPRELEAIRDLQWSPQDWAPVDVPILLIAGAETRDPVFPTVEDLRRGFPHADVDLIPGQRHLAMAFTPWRFADGVLRFVQRH